MKRFYKEAATARVDGGWQVMLDGRGVKTPAKADQIVPSQALANALAEEWNAQGEELDPKALPMRDLADYAIDQVSGQGAALTEKLLGYADTDTLAYRADPSDLVFVRQQEVWEPILTAFEAERGITLNRVSGVMYAGLPEQARAILAEKLVRLDPFQLAALEMLTSIAASLTVGWTALLKPGNAQALFDAANLEEDVQAEEWGWDQDAEEARNAKAAAFALAAHFAELSSKD